MRRIRSALLFALSAAVLACQGEARSAAVVVRDSAGIQIAEVDWTKASVTWRVDSTAEWSTDDPSTERTGLELHEVRDAAVLGDGSVVILEGSTQEIIWIDGKGGDIRRIGGRGDGPEQFRGLSQIIDYGRAGVLIFDSGRRRLSRIDRQGGAFDERAISAGPGSPRSVHRTSRGDWYLYTNGPPVETGIARNDAGDEIGTVRRPTMVLYRSPADGARLDSISAVLGPASVLGRSFMGSLVFSPTAVLAGSEEGVWMGDTATPEVSLWIESTQPRWIIRWNDREGRSVGELHRAVLWGQMEALFTAEDLAGMKGLLPFSEKLPAFEGLLVDDAGRLWIGDYASFSGDLFEAPQREQEWLVLDLENRTAGRLVTPPGLRVLRAGSRHVMGVHRDELGVESVRRYSLYPQ